MVYLLAEGQDQDKLLSQLGKHKFGKACLYIKRLADINPRVLEQLVTGSLAELGVVTGRAATPDPSVNLTRNENPHHWFTQHGTSNRPRLRQ